MGKTRRKKNDEIHEMYSVLDVPAFAGFFSIADRFVFLMAFLRGCDWFSHDGLAFDSPGEPKRKIERKIGEYRPPLSTTERDCMYR